MPFDQSEYIQNYQRENIQRVVVKLNRSHDADILEHLAQQPNKQGYIKALIRADIFPARSSVAEDTP